jgi:hypothetical protein
MKHCLLWFLILLVCISLSCNLPQSNAGNNQVLIDDVTIYPKSGSGEFDVVVSISKHDNLDTVECYVDGSRGRVVEHTEKIFADDGRTGIIFSFSFTEPGEHYLVCEAQDSGSSWPDDFTVVPDSNAPKTILLTPSANQPPVKVSLPVILNPGFEEGSNFFDPWYELPAALQYGG